MKLNPSQLFPNSNSFWVSSQSLITEQDRKTERRDSREWKEICEMSCNGCRVLRKGCSETCPLRSCLQWIESAESQRHATLFLAKFFGRTDLMSFIASVPQTRRPGTYNPNTFYNTLILSFYISLQIFMLSTFHKIRCLRMFNS